MNISKNNKYNSFDTRRNMDWMYNSHINCVYGYQKLADKLRLKELREIGFLKDETFLKAIYRSCWSARYSMKKEGGE